jgi:hypothetical protein
MIKPKVEDILLSKRLTKVINEDFYIFEADNFLPLDFFLALDKTFPERALLEEDNYNRMILKFNALDMLDKSNVSNNRVNDFFIKSPEWSHFLSLLTDNKFVYDAMNLLNTPISYHKGFKYSFRKNKYRKYVNNSKLVNKLFNNISVNFMFSETASAEALSPHTDSNFKLFTLLFYFPDKNWRSEYHGETIFYKIKNNVGQDQKRKWSLLGKKNTHIKETKLLSEFNDNYEQLYRSKYITNMIAGFVKSDKSWHSVDSMVLPKNIFRRVFIINFTL